MNKNEVSPLLSKITQQGGLTYVQLSQVFYNRHCPSQPPLHPVTFTVSCRHCIPQPSLPLATVPKGGESCVTAGRATEGSETCGLYPISQQTPPKGGEQEHRRMFLYFFPDYQRKEEKDLEVIPENRIFVGDNIINP